MGNLRSSKPIRCTDHEEQDIDWNRRVRIEALRSEIQRKTEHNQAVSQSELLHVRLPNFIGPGGSASWAEAGTSAAFREHGS